MSRGATLLAPVIAHARDVGFNEPMSASDASMNWEGLVVIVGTIIACLILSPVIIGITLWIQKHKGLAAFLGLEPKK